MHDESGYGDLNHLMTFISRNKSATSFTIAKDSQDLCEMKAGEFVEHLDKSPFIVQDCHGMLYTVVDRHDDSYLIDVYRSCGIKFRACTCNT